MKRKIPMLFESTALSILGAWGAVGCLISAFPLALDFPNRVVLAWLCWALVCGTLLRHRFGQATALGLAAVGAGWLWYEGSFGPQLLSALGTLAKAYDGGYGWGIPEAMQTEPMAADLPVAVLGMILIFAVSRAVCCRKGNALAVAALLLPLAACLVVTDTVPKEENLFGLLLCLCLLLLTDAVRRESGSQAGRLTVLAALPVALALGLLLHFCPREGFVNTTQQLRENLLASFMALPEKLQEQGLDWFSGFRQREKVELSSLPAQLLLGVPVAEVTAEQSGPVYLRVKDYDVYTGTAWESSNGRQDTLAGTGEERGMVTVNTLNLQNNLLLPAFPDGQTFLTDGAAENEEKRHEYTLALRGASMGAFPGEQWLKLPSETSRRAKALLQSICGEGSTVEQTVQAVAEYVQNTARYDRAATSMAEGETDFALWFLEQGEQGYCVHFATAAAVLLRSGGVPARYVTGYRTDALAGETVKVTSDDAHAWVEYYNYRTWTWNILEATPSVDDSAPTESLTETTQSAQPEPQTQPATVPVTQATQPPPTVQPQPVPEEKWELPLWIPVTLVTLALLWVLMEAQRLVRIGLRTVRQSKGTGNQQAVAIYRELGVLLRLLKRPVPEPLQSLVEKAMFSQHALTREELETFPASQSACRRALRRAPWWRKLLYRYWFAVI